MPPTASRQRIILLFTCLAATLRAVAAGAADDAQKVGVVDNLPVFQAQAMARVTYPLAWTPGRQEDFSAWRSRVRAHVKTRLLAPPPDAPWAAVVVAEEDRGNYVARKIVFNLTGDSRVLAYFLVPKHAGRSPAVLIQHSHSGRMEVGKEKVVRPFGVPPEKLAAAEALVAREYEGRFYGDELAKRGYACLVIDALNFSDRGGAGSSGQAALAGNLMHAGMSLAGLMVWEDLRAAEFLAQQPEVDPARIGAIGMSMGSLRTWQLTALSDRIRAGAAICWMTTAKSLMQPGNNQTVTQSAYTTLHPGLLGELDYADFASLACPKPMLFFNGREDPLFPQAGVEDAYVKLRAVWVSQGAGTQLVTRSWPGPHVFTVAMQEAAFAWLDQVLAAPTAPALPAKGDEK